MLSLSGAMAAGFPLPQQERKDSALKREGSLIAELPYIRTAQRSRVRGERRTLTTPSALPKGRYFGTQEIGHVESCSVC